MVDGEEAIGNLFVGPAGEIRISTENNSTFTSLSMPPQLAPLRSRQICYDYVAGGANYAISPSPAQICFSRVRNASFMTIPAREGNASCSGVVFNVQNFFAGPLILSLSGARKVSNRFRSLFNTLFPVILVVTTAVLNPDGSSSTSTTNLSAILVVQSTGSILIEPLETTTFTSNQSICLPAQTLPFQA